MKEAARIMTQKRIISSLEETTVTIRKMEMQKAQTNSYASLEILGYHNI